MHEPGLLQLIKNLFILFERHPDLPPVVYPQLAASEFGRRYFFEQFIHYDALALHYGMGLEHFLIHENRKEYRVFGYAMLCMKGFFLNDLETCIYYNNKAASYTSTEVNALHPFLIGRLFSCSVFQSALDGTDATEYVNEKVHYLMETVRESHDLYRGYPCAEMVFAEGLMFTGHFAAAYELLSHQRVKEYIHPPYMDIAFKTHLEVIRLCAGVYCGAISAEKARIYLDKYQESPIYFLCQNYIQLILHLVKVKVKVQPLQSGRKVKAHLETLGFSMPIVFVKQ